jgi:ubiquinone/menaquinone biosynthesis C-methylase UbiE
MVQWQNSAGTRRRRRLFLERISQTGKSILTLNRDREYSELKRMLELKPTDHLLDVGSGDGFWTLRLAKHCAYVTGLEPDNRSVASARALRSRPNISYVCGVAERLPFEDKTFDKIVSISCLEHFANPWVGIAEMARVLKPGGRVALSVDSLLPENSNADFRSWHERRHFVTHYFSQESLSAALQDAGFRNDAEGSVHLFRSKIAASLRQTFIRRPRRWLPLFPIFYLTTRVADRVFDDTHGQIIVVTAVR